MIRQPCNADDEDIVIGQAPTGLPLGSPTRVSYLLQRIRLEQAGHDILDYSSSIIAADKMQYDRIMAIDADLQRFRQELPIFFSMNKAMDDANHHVYGQSLSTQCFILHLMLHRQICQLHLPYFIQGTTEQRYAHSYKTCMESAGQIICLERQLRANASSFATVRQRMNIKLRSLFLATVILVLGACVGHEEEAVNNWQELSDVLAMLGDIVEQAPFAEKLLKFSLDMLTRNRHSHPILGQLCSASAIAIAARKCDQTTPLISTFLNLDKTRNNSTCADSLDGEAVCDLEQEWNAILERMNLGADVWKSPMWMRESQMFGV